MNTPDVPSEPLRADERPTLPDLSALLDADDYDASPSYPGDYDAFDPEDVAGHLDPEEDE